MDIQTQPDDTALRTSMAVLQFLLKNYHPRDFAIRMWDGTVWDSEPGQPARFTMVIRHPGVMGGVKL